VDEVLEPNGFVKSNASKELQQARKELSEARQKASKVFEAAKRKYKKLGWLRDFDESFYNDRRVLAVLADYKRKIDGTLHGSSETGSTAFIEPSALVPLNNDIAEARQREKREEYKILRKLTQDLRGYHGILESYEKALGFVDFTFAKARYALEIDANRPIISRQKNIELIDAYHPVLLKQNKQEGKKTVPLSMNLDHQKRILVISGPNAGGKSISLKTLGLLQLMFQSGVLIPAESHSQMGVFKQVFVDIGDDQSIAYELSTYSSRLIKMKHFLEFAHKNTLFFIDEFGTGSDPELGGAIAEVIMEELTETRAYGIVTTHYANLKIMAEKRPSMLNGSMRFDEETLLPRFELDVGHAGSSYTFEVAQKIGLNTGLIERAKEKLDERKVKFDQLLITLQTKKNRLNKETSILQEEKSKIRQQIQDSKNESERFRQKREDLNFSENKQLIEKGKKYDALIEDWKDRKKRKELSHKLTLSAEKEAAKKRSDTHKKKEKEKKQRIERQKENRKHKDNKRMALSQKPFNPGDDVKMRSSSQKGVVEEVNKHKATVIFGMIKTIVPIDKLEHIS
jgi:DNA mismatch repair protein MutS2